MTIQQVHSWVMSSSLFQTGPYQTQQEMLKSSSVCHLKAYHLSLGHQDPE